jgi:hypothetical protein
MVGTWKAVVCSFLTLGIGALNLAQARTNTTVTPPSRIVQSLDETQLVRLAGNTHPLALPKFDQGQASPSMSMDRMLLLLKRSPEQEAEVRTLRLRHRHRHWMAAAIRL